jgi:hypothetical protein
MGPHATHMHQRQKTKNCAACNGQKHRKVTPFAKPMAKNGYQRRGH